MKSIKILIPILLQFLITYNAISQNKQISYSIGPQVSTLGIGLTGTVLFNNTISISADYSFLPTKNRIEEIDNIIYDLNPSISGLVLMANYHPWGNSFSFGMGAMMGGYNLAAISTETGSNISIGNETYSSSDIGSLSGDFKVGGPSLAFHVGWRSKGFNFSLGVFTLASSASLDASGPLGNDPSVRANIDDEITGILTEIEVIPVIPYLRIGYQFGL